MGVTILHFIFWHFVEKWEALKANKQVLVKYSSFFLRVLVPQFFVSEDFTTVQD